MKTRPTGLGLTGLVSIHSPTVREGLEVITATLQTSDTGGATFLDLSRGVAEFGYAVTAPAIESADQIVDAAIAIAFNVMRRLCGTAWRPDAVRLTRKPPRDKAPFVRFFEAPVEFGAARGCLVFDAAILDRPVHDRDPHVAGILAPLLEEAAANVQGDFLSTARAMVRTQLAAGTLSRDSVCRALSLSQRTFVHRLEARGLTYTGLADEAKYEAAQSLHDQGPVDCRDGGTARLRRPERLYPRLQGLVGNDAGALAGGARALSDSLSPGWMKPLLAPATSGSRT